jgi:hypothetical protein
LQPRLEVARLNGPFDLTFDAAGNLYSANYFDGSVSKITPAGVVSAFASSGLGQGLSGIALPEPGWDLLVLAGILGVLGLAGWRRARASAEKTLWTRVFRGRVPRL